MSVGSFGSITSLKVVVNYENISSANCKILKNIFMYFFT